MKKYIINGQELYPANQVLPDNDSFELRTKFNNLLEALGTPVPEPKKECKRWRAEIGGKFYVVHPNCVGKIVHYTDDNNDVDNFIYNSGNYYQTLELAEKALDKQIALTKLNDIINEKNEGWVADWSNKEQLKIVIVYDYLNKKFVTETYSFSLRCPFILPIKSIEIAKDIIKNHKDLLDTIWGVESK